MSWQAIETAPKDRDIWVYGLAEVWVGSTEFFWQGVAGFCEDSGKWITTSHNDSGAPLYVTPTHWMPLPERPT